MGDLPGGRHYAVWRDPHPKPTYLFAAVAGAFDSLADTFTTRSGRIVHLGVHVDPGDAARAHFAMDSLKRAMIWDEIAFAREYDLDVFNIVAVRDFNFGAMENKGLNVFNSAYVLADPVTATDQDYEAIESIVEGWVAIGTQFHPEAESASALDVKIFEEFIVGITGEVPEMRLVA
jgi:aminopeptidase N